MSTAYGFDISSNQTNAESAKVAATGSFVFAKASEGTRYVSPTHDYQVALVRAARHTVGHYHFARIASEAIQEADHFLATAKARVGDLLAVDLEAMNTSNWGQLSAYALAWLDHVHARTGAIPFFYANKSWHNDLVSVNRRIENYPCWISAPSDPMGQPGISGGWIIHQYQILGIDKNYTNHWPLAPWAVPGPKPKPGPPIIIGDDEVTKGYVVYDRPGMPPRTAWTVEVIDGVAYVRWIQNSQALKNLQWAGVPQLKSITLAEFLLFPTIGALP